MGRKRKPEDEKKVSITISLPYWMVKKIEKMGARSRIIEHILSKHIKKDDNQGN